VQPITEEGVRWFEGLPHDDEYQHILEKRIDEDLAPYTTQFAKPKDMFEGMQKIARTSKKFCRSSLIVKFGRKSATENTITLEMPPAKPGDKTDNRRQMYQRMILDLDVWCKRNQKPLPIVDFVIYVTDTYVWERYAHKYPWMIMAKPTNRKGILIPDNSFMSHDDKGGEYSMQGSFAQRILRGPGHHAAGPAPVNLDGSKHLPPEPSYVWDRVKNKLAAHAVKDISDKEKVLFFKGANTGADKYATRIHLSKFANETLPLQIDLEGSKQPMWSWAKKYVLLNLPGHQSWSYRRKYLYLLKSVVFHVNVHVEYTPDDVTGDWELFFDRLFVPGEDFVQLTQYFYDDQHKMHKDGNPMKLGKLAADIAKAYGGACCLQLCVVSMQG